MGEPIGMNVAATFGEPSEQAADAIVVNLMTGAISEYQGFDFHSITPRYTGRHDGLYLLDGDDDDGEEILSTIETGRRLFNGSTRKHLDGAYFSLLGSGYGRLLVVGEKGAYGYTFEVRSNGVSRAVPGKGIRENYLSFGYQNIDGADFQLDQIEVSVLATPYRRI